MVQEIKTVDEFKDAINTEHKLVIIDFFADWCGPCKKIAPFFESLEKKYQNISLHKINCDNANLEEICSACQISSLPSFCYFINGKCVHKMVGASEKLLEENLVQFLKQILIPKTFVNEI